MTALSRSSFLVPALWAILPVVGGLAALPWVVEPVRLQALMSEQGPLEMLSALGWALAAAGLVLARRRTRFPVYAMAMVFLLLAVRETGLPPSIIPSGRRLLQWRFYLEGPESLAYRAAAGAVLLALVVALMQGLAWTVKVFLRQGAWRRPEGIMLCLAALILVGGQAGEALAGAGAAWASWVEPGRVALSFLSLEEGLECLGSLYVILAVRLSVLPLPATTA